MTTSKETSADSTHTLPGGPGLHLQEARVKAGLSVDEIASHLRLRVSVIEDLEDNQFDNMAGLVFVRGYLRAYANALNINADEIVDAFNALKVEEHMPKGNLLQKRQPSQKKERPIRWLMMVILLGVSVLAVIWWQAGRHNRVVQTLSADLVTSELNAEEDAKQLDDIKTPPASSAQKPMPVKMAQKEKRRRG